MDLYHIDQKTDGDEFQGVREHISCITEKCLSIYERRRSLYFVDRYLRRLLNGDSYMKLDIIELHLKTIIKMRYFSSYETDNLLLERLQRRES